MGYSHPDHLLSELTVSQIAEWIAFDSLHPIDHQRRLELCLASFQAQITNLAKAIHSKSKSQSKLEDFLPRWDNGNKEQKKSSTEQIKAALLMFAHQHNKAYEKKQKVKRKAAKNDKS